MSVCISSDLQQKYYMTLLVIFPVLITFYLLCSLIVGTVIITVCILLKIQTGAANEILSKFIQHRKFCDHYF